ncbi:uncharacterized protein LOC129887324 isoform X4 [Solanum dulcamara]|uniref:uncharacterized protein LOC129887324 isoform X4 n=1 Tax=Solanum dulcamara TaxID=45834 RepID=UPI00248542CA|nr:uncharacterized protein LOC129887324 isoform X4 [Solanum dulcamara]
MGTANIRGILTCFSPSLNFFAISSGNGRIKIKHGKTCTSMDMLYNGEPQRICNIAGTTDATSGFFKQGNPRYVVRSSLILPPRMLDSLGR